MNTNENQKYFSAVSIHVIHARSVELPQNSERDVFPFLQKMEVINTTDQEVLVATRQGITYAVMPSASVTRNRASGITLRMQSVMDRHAVRIDARNQLNDPIGEDQANLLKSIRGQKFDSASRKNHGLEFFVSKQELEQSGGTLYLANCDLQLSILKANDTPEHPFSRAGIDFHTVIDNNFLNSKTDLGVSLRIVDNGNKIGARYVNLGGFIFHIKPTADIMLQDGLYAVLNGVTEQSYRAVVPKPIHYPIDEMDKAFGGLYRTIEEARVYGDVAKQLERQHELERLEKDRDIKLREFELKNAELELKNQKHQYQIKLQELELELNRTKQENEFRKMEFGKEADYLTMFEKRIEHKRKLDNMKEADAIEDRAQKRKEMAEFAKVALQITAQVILGIALPLIIKTSKT